MSRFLNLHTRDKKVLLDNCQRDAVKKVIVRKSWNCENPYCNGDINKGQIAIKQAVQTPRGGEGIYYVYFHPKCCIVRVKTDEDKIITYKEIQL